jgi:hypothetical protein
MFDSSQLAMVFAARVPLRSRTHTTFSPATSRSQRRATVFRSTEHERRRRFGHPLLTITHNPLHR